MPTYDYVCDACGHELEQFQSMAARSLRKCPQCGKMKLKRLIGTGAGVIFKGSGFYQTDYRSDNYKKGAEAEKKAGTGDKVKSDDKSKTDGKSAKVDKSETKASSQKKPVKKGAQ